MATSVKNLPAGFVLDEPVTPPAGFVLDEPVGIAADDRNRNKIMDRIVFSDVGDIVSQSEIAKELLTALDEPEDEGIRRFENRFMLSKLFGVQLQEVQLLESEMIKQLYGRPLEELSAAVVNRNLKDDTINALKETPENLWIGSIGMAASVLESMKRRAIQLSGGGILPDAALKNQFEAITPDLKPARGSIENPQNLEDFLFQPDRLDFLRPQSGLPFPGTVLGEAFGVVTRLPDIGSKILRKKQRALQAQQDIATLSNAPITKLSRLVQQSGVPSMGVAVGMSLLTGNPMIGLVILGEMEGGAAFQEQLEVGGSIRKSLIIGELSGAAEIAGESLVLPKLIGGLKDGISIRRALTLVVENSAQEGVTGFNQEFLSVYGRETTKGTDALIAAKLAFVAGYEAIPENAFVGGATAGLVDIAATPANIARSRKTSKVEARRILDDIVDQVEVDLAAAPEVGVEAAVEAPVAKVPVEEVITTPEEARAELEGLSYRELQNQAKKLGIKANQKKEVLIEQIAEQSTAAQAEFEAAKEGFEDTAEEGVFQQRDILSDKG